MFNQLLNLLEKCCPPDDEHICSKHVETWNKLIIKFSASSWLILRNKYIDMYGQQNIKKKKTLRDVQLKLRVYKIISKTGIMFGSEAWALRKRWFEERKAKKLNYLDHLLMHQAESN